MAKLEETFLTTNDNALTIVSSTMMESGSDNLRNALGTVVMLGQSADTGQPAYKARRFDIDLSAEATTTTVDLRDIDVVRMPCLSNKISFIETNPSNVSAINRAVATPNFKIPFRLYANEDKVYGDVHWREIFIGGAWANQKYTNLIDSTKTYYDCTTTIAVPISYKELRKAEFNTTLDLSQIPKCALKSNYLDYNHLAQDYQNWADGLSSELLIPNYDIVSSYYYHSETMPEGGITTDKVKELQIGLTDEKMKVYNYHFPYCADADTGTEYYNELSKDQYFGSYFVNTGDNAQYRQAAMTHQQNIMYDQHYYDFLDENSIEDYEGLLAEESLDIDNKLSTFYNITLEFDRHMVKAPGGSTPSPTTLPYGTATEFSYEKIARFAQRLSGDAEPYRFNKIIDEYNFSSKFLELLKDIDEGTITGVKRNMLDFHYLHKKSVTETTEDGVVLGTETTGLNLGEKIQLPSTNFLHFLLYAYNNYDVALNDNYIFMGPPRPEHAGTSATDSLYRNMNSQNIVGVIDAAHDLQNAYFRAFSEYTAANFLRTSETILERLLSPNQKFRQVLAYKIEKFAHTPTGEQSTQTLVQKFWMFNAATAPNTLKLVDSQVKYNKNYTYKITAYTLVVSHKYKYKDFRLTKQIGTGKLLPDHDSTIQYCLQFYNPKNNNVSSQLLTPVIDSTLDDVARSAISGLNDFASSEIEVTEYPQVADFHLYIEPCLELVEVPFYQKTIKVLENPPNAINVVPFHFIDDSNRLGFKIGQDSFIQRTYPEIITPEDAVVREDFLNTKEYILSNKILNPSESPARYIEMYRITKKPTAFSDFKNALVATMDLRIHNDVYNYADHIAADEIFPNKKYYYVFRLLNENRMPGPLSQIIEAELVNDGGYIYSLFDTVDSSEFNPNKVTTNTIAFKKIMQVEPHLNQMTFDTSGVDYGDYASNQVENLIVGTADELIWDKKFKIRLTSKKTGKKLDLNMSFNKRTKDLSKLREMVAPPDEFCEPGVPTDITLDVEPEEAEELEGTDFDKGVYVCGDPADPEPGDRDEDDPPVTGDTPEPDPDEEPDPDSEEEEGPPTDTDAPPEYTGSYCQDQQYDAQNCHDGEGSTCSDFYPFGEDFEPMPGTVWNGGAIGGGGRPMGSGMPVSMLQMINKFVVDFIASILVEPALAMSRIPESEWTLEYYKIYQPMFDINVGVNSASNEVELCTAIYLTTYLFMNEFYCTEGRYPYYIMAQPTPELSLATMMYIYQVIGARVGAWTMMGRDIDTARMEEFGDDMIRLQDTPGVQFERAYNMFKNWIEAEEAWFPSSTETCFTSDGGPCGNRIDDNGLPVIDLDKLWTSLVGTYDVPDLSYDEGMAADLAGGDTPLPERVGGQELFELIASYVNITLEDWVSSDEEDPDDAMDPTMLGTYVEVVFRMFSLMYGVALYDLTGGTMGITEEGAAAALSESGIDVTSLFGGDD